MSHINDSEGIQIAWHLWKEGIKVGKIAERVDRDRATVYRWIKRFKTIGLKRTLVAHKNAKKGRRRKRISLETKLHIFAIREKYSNCCGEKVKYYLEQN